MKEKFEGIFRKFWLVFFLKNKISHDEVIHFRIHETTIGLIGRAYNWLITDIKTCVYKNTVGSFFLESSNEFPKSLISIFRNSLDAGRIIKVSHRWNI